MDSWIAQRLSRALVALALAAFALPPAVAAQSVKLNGSLAQPDASDVTDYAISPDGTRVVYRGDQDLDEVFELFSAPLDGSAPAVRLHAALADDGQDVGAFAIGAGGRVVFVADLGANGASELFSAPIDGSASPIALSGSLPADRDVVDFLLTPDGTRAVYRADATVDDTLELLSVAVDGSSAPLPLDPQHRPCELYRVDPNSSLAYFAYFDDFVQELLYRVPLDASQAPELIADSGPPGFVSYTIFDELQIAPGGQHAAFRAAEVFFDGSCGECEFHVYGLLLTGSTPTAHLNQNSAFSRPRMTLAGSRVVFEEFAGFGPNSLYTTATNGTDRTLLGTSVSDFSVSPDESLVVFVAGVTLWIAPADGSAAPVALAGPVSQASPRVNASSTLVIFMAADPDTSFRGLWAVPTTGGVPLLLNGPAIPGGFGAKDFALSPEGAVVVYREDRAQDERIELWSVDTSLVPRNLSGPLADFQDVLSYQISPDGQRVVHLADRNANDVNDLFGTAIDSGDPLVQYNDPSLSEGPVVGDVTNFVASADESLVLYRADQESDEVFELYAVESDGDGSPVRLTETLSQSSSVLNEFHFTPSGERAVFVLQSSTSTLYSAPTSGAGPLAGLDSSPPGFQFPLAVLPDGSAVLYRKFVTGGVNLYRAPIDGSQPPITLADPPSGAVLEFRVTPDGLTVIYMGGSPVEVFSVPSDGSAAPIPISAPLVANGSVDVFRVSPDSARVVYRADQDVQLKDELYSAPSDGNGFVVKLNGALPAAGDVSEFAIASNAASVVYRADQTFDNRFELYGVPIDASAPSVRLTPLLANRQVTSDFVLAGVHAYYRADVATSGQFDLFRVAIDGSTSPLQLSASVDTNEDVNAFAVSPDESRVVYLADSRVNDVFELFSVPATGGTALPLVTLPAFGDVTTFRIEPQSGFVLYLADANVDLVPELFRVPLDGSKPPRRLHPALTTNRMVLPDFVPLSGGDALYRADRESDDVFELYRSYRLQLGLDDRAQVFPAPTRSASVVR